MDRRSLIDEVKQVIKQNYSKADCGLDFYKRPDHRIAGDVITTVWQKDGITVDICRRYAYFEITGLTDEEEAEIKAFYEMNKYKNNNKEDSK